MSTLASAIIAQSFREGNIVSIGETATPDELAEALPRLNGYLFGLFAHEIGEHLRDWYVPNTRLPHAPIRTPYTPDGTDRTPSQEWTQPPANARLMSKVTSSATIYFPANPSDGARMALVDVGAAAALTLDGNGRKIQGQPSLTEAAAAEFSGRKWLYRADLGDWILLTTLVATDEVPLPEEFDDLLITGLFLRLAPRFGIKEPDMLIVARHADMLKRLKTRYKQTETQPGNPDLSSPRPVSIYTGF